ncbi:MAG TPA: PIG-L family deacetylase, partial [Planctomycetaceae bacterium]|nr:PIG-L family deacetylase [Planctomycetaceae bacterium]
DLFTRPCPLRPDVVLDVTADVETIVAMLACHHSQVFEWLPYGQGVLDQVPPDDDGAARRAWLRDWFAVRTRRRCDRFRDALVAAFGETRGRQLEFCEVYEISEYAAPLDADGRQRLFALPGA